MKSFLGQYGKIIILVLVLMPLLTFMFYGGFKEAMPKDDHLQTHVTDKEDSEILVDDIAAREKPELTIRVEKLKYKQYVQFLDFATAKFAPVENLSDVTNQKVIVKRIKTPDDTVLKNQTEPVRVKHGIYKVTYRAEETYKTALKYTEQTVNFIVDK